MNSLRYMVVLRYADGTETVDSNLTQVKLHRNRIYFHWKTIKSGISQQGNPYSWSEPEWTYRSLRNVVDIRITVQEQSNGAV